MEEGTQWAVEEDSLLAVEKADSLLAAGLEEGTRLAVVKGDRGAELEEAAEFEDILVGGEGIQVDQLVGREHCLVQLAVDSLVAILL